MHLPLVRLFAAAALLAFLPLHEVQAGALPPECPPSGGSLRISLARPAGVGPTAAVVFGTLAEPSCRGGPGLATGYARFVACETGGACQAAIPALVPGRWTHRLLVVSGNASGQLQGRRDLLLADAAGESSFAWPIYASVATVSSLVDSASCTGCLRAAILAAELGAKPALVQFAPALEGTITLAAALPALASGRVTIDGFDVEGAAHRRTIDGNALNAAALRVTGPDNVVAGLRVVNVGGNSDAVLIDGTEANRNLLESLFVIGRSLMPCGGDERGCLVDGSCRTVQTDPPLGACGDDGIAVRGAAGTGGPNVIRECEVIGAFDKGIKISNAAVARVERCHLHDNADGGLQATLGGHAIAVENLVESNRGTNSANGIAANGPDGGVPPAARLETQGNLVRSNALRGISVRSLSIAWLRDDHVCGNGTAGFGGGIGVAVLDAAGLSSQARAEGLAVVHNVDGGVVVGDTSSLDLGGPASSGDNAIAFNGPDDAPEPVNLRNQTALAVSAVGNHWESCGRGWQCDVGAVLEDDVVATRPGGSIAIAPARPPLDRAPVEVRAVVPVAAAAGEIVRIYGRGFDALEGNAPNGGCDDIAAANACDPPRGNCVVVGGREAEVVAVTPTMLAVRSPLDCVEPVRLEVRSGRARGIGRADFCRTS